MRKAHWIIMLFIMLPALPCLGQSVHYLRCLSVDALSYVTISWEKPATATAFSSYKIFHAETGNPTLFQEIAEIGNYDITSFVHTDGSAGQMINLYYMETILNSGASIFSDTLRTIFLQADDNGEGEVILSWNDLHSPVLPSASGTFSLFIEYPLGSWEQLASTSLNTYRYEISICEDTLSFQVVLQDDWGCSSASNINGGIYRDIIKPPMPSIDSVSIDLTDQEIVIGWEPSVSQDAVGYLIYRYINNNWIPVDTLWGRDNTVYMDAGVQPCLKSQAYALATLDSCGNKSLGTFLLPQQSILLENIVFDPCQLSASLFWSPYINMQPEISGYQVSVSVDGGQYELIGTTDPGETSFIHQGLQELRQYSYYVRAFNSLNHGSSSCEKSFYAFAYGRPAFHYLANVTVVNNQYIDITMHVDISATVTEIKLYRAEGTTGVFEEIASIPLVNGDIVSYSDDKVNIQAFSYRYMASLIDSCGNEILQTKTIPSILLEGNFITDNEIQLEWNEFSGWDGSIESYRIFRVINGAVESTPLATLPAGTLEYTDQLTEPSSTVSSFDYIVAAYESDDNSYGFKEASYSNVLQLEADPRIYMPNAFRPGGTNQVFKPVGNFIDQSNYTFQVYNRWGTLVFESQSFHEGWDGTYNGDNSPAGVYIYLLRYQIRDGSLNTMKGSFVLIR